MVQTRNLVPFDSQFNPCSVFDREIEDKPKESETTTKNASNCEPEGHTY